MDSIVFFGSGPVAAESLRLLVQDFTIEAVVTKPRPPHHKGDVPVVSLCEELNLKFHTAANKTELDQLFTTASFKSQVAVLIDFGIIVSKLVINYFPKGIVNSHFSLLPEWRGADPITFALLSGQQQTGVSLMLLVEAMDEGPLLSQAIYDIAPKTDILQMTQDLIKLSHSSLASILPLYLKGEVDAAPQESVTLAASQNPTYSRKLTKNDGRIDWQKPAEQLDREIRAFLGWPGSRTAVGDIQVIITKAHVVDQAHAPGSVRVSKDSLVIGCKLKSLGIDEIKPVGKQVMPIRAFLAGYGSRL